MLGPASTYAPAVLIVEDDRPAREYYRDKFYGETSLGVMVAKDLKEARVLLESRVHIDAIIADLFFDFDKDDPEFGLRDGLDVLSFSVQTHPGVLQYVNSFWTDRGEYLERAKELRLPIKAWFSKQFRMPGDDESPWAQVERDLLESRLLHDSTLREKGDLPDKLDTVTDAIRHAICPTRRTYLQELGDPRFGLIQPLEVLCWRSVDGVFYASAHKLGLLTDGSGENLSEALDELKHLVVEHKLALDVGTEDAGDYASFVRARLLEYVSEIGDGEK